jgi:glycosyltransferase involved in cell wall biosynthesis
VRKELSRNAESLKSLHIASGDLWAGAEVQLFTLLTQLRKGRDIEPHAAIMNEGELARRLRLQNIPVTIFDETRLSGFEIMLGLRKLMRTLKPDIVHTHRAKENVLGSVANLLAGRSRSVRTCHGAAEHAPRGLRNLHRRVFYLMDFFCGNYLQQKIIAVSTPLGRELINAFGKRVVVVDNGVDIERLQSDARPAEFRAAAPNATHIGIVGRLEPVKRVDIFLRMARRLRDEAPERHWHFHIIGDGSQAGTLKALAAELRIQPIVTFHGHRSDSAACLAALDALVMCSDHEGMPMTPLESIAIGTPVVAHDVGGLSDILAGGAGGALNQDHAPEGYARALLALLDSDKDALLASGRARVAERFSAASNAQKIAALYRSLIGR